MCPRSGSACAPLRNVAATSNHNRSAATFLSGAHAEAGPRAHLGITMDQFAAQHIGQDTPLPSVEMMIEDATLSCGTA